MAFLINVDWYFLLHWKERALAAKNEGYKVFVLTKITSQENREEIERLGFSLVDIAISRHGLNPLYEIRSVLTVISTMRRLAIDIVHAITIKPILYASLVQMISPRYVVFGFPGLGALSSNEGVLANVFWSVTKPFLKRPALSSQACGVFENGEDRDLLLRRGIPFKSSQVILGAGVNTKVFQPIEPPEDGVFRVLFAARLLKSKGLLDLVAAVGDLWHGGCSIELHIAGIVDGSHSDAITQREIDRFSAQQYVIWHGKINDMVRLINRVDVVCLPTVYGEGIPRILIEAAACGRPIITTDVAGCREIVVDGVNGFLIPRKSPLALFESLKTLSDNSSQRRVFGRNGRRMVEEQFTNEIVIDRTLAVYAGLFNKDRDVSLGSSS